MMQISTLTTMSAKKRCAGAPRIESKDYIYNDINQRQQNKRKKKERKEARQTS